MPLYVPCTCIAVFWDISNILVRISYNQISYYTPMFCVASIFMGYCYIYIKLDIQSYNIWMNKCCLGCSPLGESHCETKLLGKAPWQPLLEWNCPGTEFLTHWGGDKWPTIFQMTFSNGFSWNENVWIAINISLKFVPRGLINYIPTLVQVMAWRRPGDKPLSEPMMVRLPMHICVTRPQWIKSRFCNLLESTGTQSSNEVQ